MPRPQLRAALALIALASSGVSVAGCGSSSSITAAGSASTQPTAASTAPADSPAVTATAGPSTAASGAGAAELTQIPLRDSDASNGATFALVPGGDKVEGEVSLDNCAYRFTSEQDRRARRQTALNGSSGRWTGLSNEVLAYDTPEHAAQALAQWRASVAGCTFGVDVKPAVAGAPVLRYRTEKVRTEPRLPVAANAVTTGSVTVKATGKKLYLLVVMQQKGKILDTVWLTSPSAPPPAAAVDSVLRLAATTGKRLAAL